MPQTSKESVLALKIKDVIEDNHLSVTSGGLDIVYFGDQRIIRSGKAVAVEPIRKRREYASTGSFVNNFLEVRIIVYVDLDTGVQNVLQTSLEIAESIEDLINTNAKSANEGGDRLGGLILDGFITDTEHGFRVAASETMRASSLTFTGRTRTGLV